MSPHIEVSPISGVSDEASEPSAPLDVAPLDEAVAQAVAPPDALADEFVSDAPVALAPVPNKPKRGRPKLTDAEKAERTGTRKGTLPRAAAATPRPSPVKSRKVRKSESEPPPPVTMSQQEEKVLNVEQALIAFISERRRAHREAQSLRFQQFLPM
jgi:hypothetical protein